MWYGIVRTLETATGSQMNIVKEGIPEKKRSAETLGNSFPQAVDMEVTCNECLAGFKLETQDTFHMGLSGDYRVVYVECPHCCRSVSVLKRMSLF